MDLRIAVALLKSLRSCSHAMKRYSVGDNMIARNLSSFRELAHEWLIEVQEIVIRLEGQIFSFNGYYLEPIQNREPVVKWLYDICTARRIYEIRLSDGFSELDLKCLLGVLHETPERFHDVSVARQMMVSASITRISVNPPSLEDSFNDIETTFNEERPIPLAAPVEKEPELALSEKAREDLSRGIHDLLRQKNYPRVTNILRDMHFLLANEDRDERSRAYACYRVVVDALIEKRNDQLLYSVIKSMAKELVMCNEDDLIQIHLETFGRVLNFFRDRNFKPVVFGLTALVALKEKRPNWEDYIDKKLSLLLEPHYLEALLTAGRVDPELRPYLTSFLEKAPSIADYLLEALYASEDKYKRKLLLDALMRPGKKVYPDILRRLRMALADGAPWYVKRNLLFILATDPPAGLAEPLLQMWDNELHPKVRQLLERCLFSMDEDDCVERGIMLLNNGNPEDVTRYLHSIEAGRVKAYAPALIKLVRGHGLLKLRIKALTALGRMDDDKARDLLHHVVDDHKMGIARWKSSLRCTAVRALADDPANHLFLERYREDSDQAVRTAVESALAGNPSLWISRY
ncbi:MAG: HEAT repeat domain-containing protein [Acidobacteriota bacterium]|nr:HEAT repeat domain-containing protein [Acidobacteriota bacterium]